MPDLESKMAVMIASLMQVNHRIEQRFFKLSNQVILYSVQL